MVELIVDFPPVFATPSLLSAFEAFLRLFACRVAKGKKMDAVDAARAFVKERFPDCLVAFLAGSAARGQETASSDLDIMVITGEHVSYNESIYDFGWPIEVFVECVDHYQVFLRQGVDHQRLPYMAFMISEALVIKDQEELAERIQGEAKMILEQGPSPLTEKEIKDYRYKITSVLNDFTSSEDYGESLFIVNRLTVLCSYILFFVSRSLGW